MASLDEWNDAMDHTGSNRTREKRYVIIKTSKVKKSRVANEKEQDQKKVSKSKHTNNHFPPVTLPLCRPVTASLTALRASKPITNPKTVNLNAKFKGHQNHPPFPLPLGAGAP